MLYIAAQLLGNECEEMSHKLQSVKLVYVMTFPQDDWFEVQGGVGKKSLQAGRVVKLNADQCEPYGKGLVFR